MRRNRSVREHRNDLIKRRAASASDRRKRIHEKLLAKKLAQSAADTPNRRATLYEKIRRRKKAKAKETTDFKQCASYSPLELDEFTPYDLYEHTAPQLRVCHLIHSLGLGGAQTMMFELVHGLNKYFGNHITNHVVWVYKKQADPGALSTAYGFDPEVLSPPELKAFCEQHKIDVVLHHRTAMARCMRSYLPERTKYILLNHTWHNLHRMRDFLHCDSYVSVCDFLNRRTQWPEFIHETRRHVILNGVENDYIADIDPRDLGEGFHVGRCHRMVGGKFRPDSLQWMIGKVRRNISTFNHHMIGTHKQAKVISQKADYLHYYGTILDRTKKMSIIKSLDAYFYETFQEEGASIAILEALACGVPVICKPKGGNNELVKDKFNGFLVGDRSDFLMRMMALSSRQTLVDHMSEQTLEDFNNRLHIKHTACKYMQLFTALVHQV